MTDIQPIASEGALLIKSFQDDSVLIQQNYIKPVFSIIRDQIFSHDFSSLESVNQAYIDRLLEHNINLLLIGCGKKMLLPSKDLRLIASREKIALETMNSQAACRTYNIARSEERDVALLVLDL